MNGDDFRVHLARPTRMLQLIVGAMIFGASAFLAVAGVFPHDAPAEPSAKTTPPILTYVAVGFGAVALIARPVAAAIITRPARARIARGEPPVQDGQMNTLLPAQLRGTDAGQLYALFAQLTIIRSALIEGAALLACMAWLQERQLSAFAAAIVLILALAITFPTCDRVGDWIDAQMRHLERERAAVG